LASPCSAASSECGVIASTRPLHASADPKVAKNSEIITRSPNASLGSRQVAGHHPVPPSACDGRGVTSRSSASSRGRLRSCSSSLRFRSRSRSVLRFSFCNARAAARSSSRFALRSALACSRSADRSSFSRCRSALVMNFFLPALAFRMPRAGGCEMCHGRGMRDGGGKCCYDVCELVGGRVSGYVRMDECVCFCI